MQRLLIEASPRGPGSNSALLASWLAEGIAEVAGEKPDVLHLSRRRELAAQTAAFIAAEEVTIVFPLYTDSTPGILKAFIDGLAELDPALLRGKCLAWVIHCGFPESAHLEPVAAWLHRLSARLGFVDLGIALRSGSTPLNLMPPQASTKTSALFRGLGADLASGRPFDPAVIASLARPRAIGPARMFFIRLLKPTGLMDLYWIVMLRTKGGWKKRFARPWAPAVG